MTTRRETNVAPQDSTWNALPAAALPVYPGSGLPHMMLELDRTLRGLVNILGREYQKKTTCTQQKRDMASTEQASSKPK